MNILIYISEEILRKKRIRIKWQKAMTLVNNPALVMEYIDSKMKKEKGAGLLSDMLSVSI